jgi:natural product precursor
MKKLGLLKLNREKIINDEELKILKGGDTGSCQCWCYDGPMVMGIMASLNQTDCFDDCHYVNPNWDATWNCIN